MSKEDLRVVKTLESIELSLLSNLNKYPLAKITVDTICKEARINRSTFYKYYSDKYDLLNNYLTKVLSEFKKMMDVSFIYAAPSKIGEDKYSDKFQEILDFFNLQKETYEILWGAIMERDIYNEMIDIIQNNIFEQMEKIISKDSDSYVFLTLFSRLFPSNLMTGLSWWYKYQHKITREDFTRLTDHTMSFGIFTTFREYVEF